jgi:hypothetical protein
VRGLFWLEEDFSVAKIKSLEEAEIAHSMGSASTAQAAGKEFLSYFSVQHLTTYLPISPVSAKTSKVILHFTLFIRSF